MTDFATPALAELRDWYDQQNPLVRALSEPVVQLMTRTVTVMQEVIDVQAATIVELRAQVEQATRQTAEALACVDAMRRATDAQLDAMRRAMEAEAQRHEEVLRTALQAQAAEHAAAREAMAAEYAAALRAQAEEHAAALQAQAAEYAAALQAQAKEHAAAMKVATERIDHLERRLFGQKSERAPKTPDPRGEARKRRRAELSDEEKKARQQQAAQARQRTLEGLRTKVIDIPLDADVAEGRPLPPLETVLYEWHPGELVRLIIRRQQRVLPDGSIVTAPPPPQVIEGGTYGPALHAKVTVDKCLNAMPLRRQERAFARVGAPLPASVLFAMFHRSAAIIEPLYVAMMEEVRTSPHVSADETPQPVLDEERTRKGWMWVFATEQAILYVFSASRGGKVADGVLASSRGTLTVDGYTGYNLVTQPDRRQRGGCWSHARRGLFEARGYAELLVDELLSDIGELFYVEQLAIEGGIVGTEEHLRLRQERSAPVVARVFARAEQAEGLFEERSSVGKALRYVLNQREPLSLFLKEAGVPIHNNLSERMLRIVALLRKNALFVGSDDGGKHLAWLLSMTATCQLHGVDPERWLADVLLATSAPGYRATDLLPWNWKVGRGLTAKPAFDTT